LAIQFAETVSWKQGKIVIAGRPIVPALIHVAMATLASFSKTLTSVVRTLVLAVKTACL
jgi:hypothetical protein